MSQRFTIDGSGSLEDRLSRTCKKVAQGVGTIVPARKLQAIVLGGGYGRGQGGVLKTGSGDEPYNDLEFYVFVRGARPLNEIQYRRALNTLGERLSPEAGLHVEFKVDSLARLAVSPVSMFSYDLLTGHRIILGDPGLFQHCDHHREADRIPLEEAARLLLNRCTGLLLVRELLEEKSSGKEQADFIYRNISKARLALGDALLVASRRYHWDCLERKRRLENMRPFAELQAHWPEILQEHAAGVEFKLHPVRKTPEPLMFQANHERVSRLALRLWLFIESCRLKRPFSTVSDYAFAAGEKCSGTVAWRNYLLNLRSFGLRSSLDTLARKYPRERLFNSLPLLLWSEEWLSAPHVGHLQRQLRTEASDWRGLVQAYKEVWPHYG